MTRMDDPNKPVLNYYNADGPTPAAPERRIGVMPLIVLIYLVLRVVAAILH